MAKPTITTRTDKGAALTYAELDTNFTNLRDATLSIDANGTVIVLDLNDTLILAPGTNISFTVVDQTLTINSSGSSGLSIDPVSGDYECAADIDLNGYVLRSNGGNITVGDDITFPSGAGPQATNQLLIRGNPISMQSNTVEVGDNISGLANINSRANNVGLALNSSGGGYIDVFDNGQILILSNNSQPVQISSTAGLTLNASTSSEFTLTCTKPVYMNSQNFRVPVKTTTERNADPVTNGIIIYNSTDNKFQGYANGAWVNLH